MKRLLIMRHADADYKGPGESDVDRRLNAWGIECAARMGAHLQGEGGLPRLLISSTAVRARMTTEQVVGESGNGSVEVRFCADFYLAPAVRYLQALVELDYEEEEDEGEVFESVLVVGHNPGVSELVFILTGTHCEMPTAAIATVEMPIEKWSELENLGTGASALVSQCQPPQRVRG